MSFHQKKMIIISFYNKIITKNLSKYNKSKEELSQNIIKQLIFHKKSHFTSIFIEYLILDDYQEFLSRFFRIKNFSRIIPNLNTQKTFHPTLVDSVGRSIVFTNIKKKKVLVSNLSQKTKPTSNNTANQNNFYNILPPDLSGENKIFEDEEEQKNYEKKSLKNESETIDNINANDDISISLDLKINKKYDENIMHMNAAFVKGKNGENDKEIMKVIKFLKPIQSELIYRTKKNAIINRNRASGLNYHNVLNNNKNDKYNKNKFDNYYKSCNSSDNKIHKKGKNIIHISNNKKNDFFLNEHNMPYNNIKRIKNSLSNNKNKNNNISNLNIKENNIFKINEKQINHQFKIHSNPQRSKEKSNSKNKRNIILISGLKYKTSSTKANSNINVSSNHSKNKTNKINKSINNTQPKNDEIKSNSKILNLNLPYSSKVEGKTFNSNSSKYTKNENLKTNNNKVKKIILDKKIISTNLNSKCKSIDKSFKYNSPEDFSKNFLNSKIIKNKLLIERIICAKKEKSFDNKYSLKNLNKNKSPPSKISSTKSKKL